MGISPLEVPSGCPECHKPMWRKGRMLSFQWKGNKDDEGQYSVCRHCSGIFKLSERRGQLKWVYPSPADLAQVLPTLGPISIKFAAIAALERLSPGWLDRAEAQSPRRDKRRDN
jgi:hypothetical protein